MSTLIAGAGHDDMAGSRLLPENLLIEAGVLTELLASTPAAVDDARDTGLIGFRKYRHKGQQLTRIGDVELLNRCRQLTGLHLPGDELLSGIEALNS